MGLKKKLGAVIIGGAIIIGGITLATSVERIPQGYVGVVYNINGGIQKETLSQGYHLVSPTKKVTKYPISMEQITLSKSTEEGDKKDESFLIPTSSGKTVNVDLESTISFNEKMIPKTFSEFRGKNAETIIDTFIKPKIKAWVGEITSQYDVLDIYGDKRNEINNKCLAHLQDKFKGFGINIDSLNFTRIEPDAKTMEAIQNRVNAQQKLEQEKVEKEKAIIEAEKKKIEAQGESDAQFIKAQGEAKANKEVAQSITDGLIKMKEAEARVKHGWVEVQSSSAIVDTRDK